MHARVSRIRGDKAAIESGTRWFTDELVPQLEQIPGYRDAMLLIDRAHGESLAITFWDSADAMAESERRADQLRAAGASALSGAVAGVERFEVAVQASSISASA